MDAVAVGLDGLTRAQRAALRTLLIRSTAAAGRAADPERIAAAVAAAPVAALPAAAALHRVSGCVLLGVQDVVGVPDDVRAQLTARQHQTARQHLVMVGALNQIARALDAAGLSWVVMKGPVLAALFYPDIGDRTYGDLDLLVARRDFPTAMHILEELGYQHTIHNWALAETMLAGQVGLRGSLVSIDLHWHLHYSRQDRRPFALDPEAMLERARRVLVSGARVPTLDPVDTVLTLAFHAARSDGHRLLWLKDIERAVAIDRPDLDELVRRCRDSRCAAPVGVILGRARGLLGADIPDDVIDALAPVALRTVDRVASRISHPVPLHERSTPTRWLTRSVRSTLGSSVASVPARGARSVLRAVRPPAANETDDAVEKASYLRAVASST
jgi:hypothetical protein